jgi:hypothetical protein
MLAETNLFLMNNRPNLNELVANNAKNNKNI